MPKLDIPRLIPGDDVTDGQRTGRVVWSFPRKLDGQRFLMVALTAPGVIGAREWATDKWRPLLDWQDTGLTMRCKECEREFRPALDEHGLKRVFCRTCDRLLKEAEEQHGRDASARHWFGAHVNRTRRRE
jgi:hypothetical protein